MGEARKIKEALRQTRERKWVLDPDTGGIAEEEPTADQKAAPKPRPARVQAAYRTYD